MFSASDHGRSCVRYSIFFMSGQVSKVKGTDNRQEALGEKANLFSSAHMRFDRGFGEQKDAAGFIRIKCRNLNRNAVLLLDEFQIPHGIFIFDFAVIVIVEFNF